MPARSLMVPRSMRSEGDEGRSFIACTRLWPPARYRPSLFWPASPSASLVLVGRWYWNACIANLLLWVLAGLVHGAPHVLRGGGHGDVFDAEGVGDCVHHGGRRADRAGFAAAFDAERIVRAGRLARVDLEQRHVGRARDAVIRQRPAYQLPVLVVGAVLGECLADALREAAVHLPFDDHRVDHL